MSVWAWALIVAALAWTVGAPLVALAIGPILWGVPHLLADARYLVVRPGLHRQGAATAVAALSLLVVGVSGTPLWGALGVAAVGGLAPGHRGRRVAVTAAAGLVAVIAARWPYMFALAFAHAHNLIAIVLWWMWRRRDAAAGSVLVGVAVVTALLCAGVFDDLAFAAARRFDVASMPLYQWETTLAPGAPHPWALRLVLLFAFAQIVHYGVWLRLIPEDDRPRETPRTFAASWRALVDDFGRWPLWITVIASLGLALWAVADLAQAHTGYLRFAVFHGYLECMVLAWWCASGTRATAAA